MVRPHGKMGRTSRPQHTISMTTKTMNTAIKEGTNLPALVQTRLNLYVEMYREALGRTGDAEAAAVIVHAIADDLRELLGLPVDAYEQPQAGKSQAHRAAGQEDFDNSAEEHSTIPPMRLPRRIP